MIIPEKIVFDGPDDECFRRIGAARRIMHILENMMALRRIDQHIVRVLTGDGALITCSKIFGVRKTVITVGPGIEKIIPAKRKCLCGCNYTEGWIFRVNTTNLEDDGSTLYDVMACYNEDRYILVKDVIASDFTIYEEAWPVLMVPYNQMAYLCCDVPTGSTGCKPIKSLELRTDADWRTTYRIIPWCALRVPKWRNVYA